MKNKVHNTLKQLHYPKALKLKRKPIQNQIPGKITYVGEETSEETVINVISYNEEKVVYHNNCSLEKVLDLVTHEKEFQHWINFIGVHDVKKLADLGNLLQIHPLVLEDIANTKQRPKLDEFEDYVFFALKMIFHNDAGLLIKNHFGIVFNKSYIISFQQSQDSIFNSIRDRIHNKVGRIRMRGTDYLFYALIDAVVDNYYNVTETIEEKTENLEDRILKDAHNASTSEIQLLKREILSVRKAIFPAKELIRKLQISKHELYDQSTKAYLADLYDHILQVTENVDIYREIVWGLMDMYMSSLSNKMNQVMKVLTIMSSIFIPLTFIAGVYGMNFEFMPELGYRPAYFIVWGVMLVMTLALIYFFKRKNWF
ncbi:magnesium/cobalt transporter CorA [Psychroflexus sediminis]|uniref:magnesium/cobalt transporter CorA n=1 Tax=Psychroflexus sediminis TaxID=470826 RepID=UPI000B84073D|nr:magnesium/cobalt transporter CorA [Psychroflexus sediminis]